MPRSAGITFSAVVAIIGSVFTLLGGAMMALGSLFMSKVPSAANVPAIFDIFVILEAVILFGFGGWGLAAGIGLFKLKKWARISLLVFAAILVFVSLPAAVLLAVISFPNTNDPNLPSNFMSIMRIGMVLFYATFAALGGFWLYFFNKRSVKAQFQGERLGVEPAQTPVGVGTPVVALSASSGGSRPLSITIIGWFLLIGSAFGPLGLAFSHAVFPGVQLPLFFLGFFLYGGSAALTIIVWMAVQTVAAVGLLKLKRWGLYTTIGLQSLAIVNSSLLVGIPSIRTKFQHILEAMLASLDARMPQPFPVDFWVWLGLASSLPFVVVILWFLITRRGAFTSGAQELAC